MMRIFLGSFDPSTANRDVSTTSIPPGMQALRYKP